MELESKQAVHSVIKVVQNQVESILRLVFVDNEPWFCAKDVCSLLRIKNSNDATSRIATEKMLFHIQR